MILFQTKGYSTLELFAESDSGKEGFIELRKDGHTIASVPAGGGYYRYIKQPLERDAEYCMIVHDCQTSVSYLSGHEDILKVGVCFLEDEVQMEPQAFAEFCDTPFREQYHFHPFKNWINDPNGLCWYQGNYHMFYQANPHEQRWDDMYWGHCVSSDLVHWIHLPYVLFPQQELLENPNRKGGAFSGSAVPLEDQVVFYLTRHDGPQEDGADTVEWQTMMRSTNLLEFQPEVEIIREKPEGAGHDFRDPKVLKIGDYWYMVLGSNLDGVSAILLYRSADMEKWEYTGPLLREEDRGSTTIECPDFFFLDGTYVATGALMKHRDAGGRYQMTRCYLGDWKEERLQVRQTQWFDFGSNYYAVQSFEHQGRRIAIGWISDFYGEHVAAPSGAYGSMALPRELHVKNNHLYMKPVEEVYRLLGQQLYKGSAMVGIPEIEGNCYYVKAEFSGDTDFAFLLGEDREQSIWLKREQGITRIQTQGTKSSQVDFCADVTQVRKVEVFVDRRTVEVYLNDGEAAGTKIFYNRGYNGVFNAKVADTNDLREIEVYKMKTIW